MAQSPSGSGGLSSGDPLGGGQAEPPRHESVLPGPPARARAAEHRPRLRVASAPGRRRPDRAPLRGEHHGRPYVLASWLSRVGAQLIDGLIIGAGALILFLPIGAALGIGAANDSDTGVGAAIVGLALLGGLR